MSPRSRQPGRPRWGCSSAGRAPESHSGGRRFDPVQLHDFTEDFFAAQRLQNDSRANVLHSGGEILLLCLPAREHRQHLLLPRERLREAPELGRCERAVTVVISASARVFSDGSPVAVLGGRRSHHDPTRARSASAVRALSGDPVASRRRRRFVLASDRPECGSTAGSLSLPSARPAEGGSARGGIASAAPRMAASQSAVMSGRVATSGRAWMSVRPIGVEVTWRPRLSMNRRSKSVWMMAACVPGVPIPPFSVGNLIP